LNEEEEEFIFKPAELIRELRKELEELIKKEKIKEII